jgi:hypothetical protein
MSYVSKLESLFKKLNSTDNIAVRDHIQSKINAVYAKMAKEAKQQLNHHVKWELNKQKRLTRNRQMRRRLERTRNEISNIGSDSQPA